MELNDALFNATAYSETSVWLSLHTADPGTTGASEVSGEGYGRQQSPAAASSSGTYTSGSDLRFDGMPAGTVTHAGLWDAETGGNFLAGTALTASVTVNSGDSFRILAGNLTSTFS